MAVLKWSAATDAGRARSSNQDSVLTSPPLFAVADGMGGHADGDVASRLAVGELDAARAGGTTMTRDSIASAIARANAAILRHSGSRGDGAAGTTLTGMAIVHNGGVEHWLVFNVGDSRVYRWIGDEVTQITVDHSEVQELVAAGRIDAGDARRHELSNVVTRALGSDPPPDVDWWLLPVSEGERFILCSDGLPAELRDDEIARLTGSAPVDEVANLLVDGAVSAGGRDNVTVIALEVVAVGNRLEIDEDTHPRPSIGVGS